MIASGLLFLLASLTAPQILLLLLYLIPGGAWSRFSFGVSQDTVSYADFCAVCMVYCVFACSAPTGTARLIIVRRSRNLAPKNHAGFLYTSPGGLPPPFSFVPSWCSCNWDRCPPSVQSSLALPGSVRASLARGLAVGRDSLLLLILTVFSRALCPYLSLAEQHLLSVCHLQQHPWGHCWVVWYLRRTSAGGWSPRRTSAWAPVGQVALQVVRPVPAQQHLPHTQDAACYVGCRVHPSSPASARKYVRVSRVSGGSQAGLPNDRCWGCAVRARRSGRSADHDRHRGNNQVS